MIQPHLVVTSTTASVSRSIHHLRDPHGRVSGAASGLIRNLFYSGSRPYSRGSHGKGRKDGNDESTEEPTKKAEESEEIAREDDVNHLHEEGPETEDVFSEEAPSSERSLVQATVPEYYPDVLAVPVSRRPVFPGFYKTITVRDSRVATALTRSLKMGRPYVGLFLAKDSNIAKKSSKESTPSTSESKNPSGPSEGEDPDVIRNINEVHRIGVFAKIINVIPMPSEGLTAIVYPHRRIRATELLSSPAAAVSQMRTENVIDAPYDRKDRTIRAISQEIFAVLADVAKLNAFFREHITHHNVPTSVFEEASKLADFVAVLSSAEPAELQDLLEETSIEERLRKALVLLKKELVTAQLQHAISKEVEQKLSQKQREYFLHEQLKAIKKELGLEADSKEKLIQLFTERVAKLRMPEAVKKVFDEEMNKLSVLEPAGAEFNVTRNYLDWLSQMPWGLTSADRLDVPTAARILDEDHYGLEDVKERILEFIAVSSLKGSVTGKILCLVGPPGVGKTSIGKSIARALGREYFRFSVGGLTDVAEIKGHRRTYVGAMPGKLVQALKKVQTENPLILIDEVDKIGRGHQGDPASALLELLDPEQNSSFLDHYLDVPMDLGKVLFMCTANTTDTIPPPLLDRMEVITLSGYVAQEKLQIAKKYLVPQAQDAAGVTDAQVSLTDGAIEILNRQYCRESGVRNLKKQIEKIFRKAALRIVKSTNGKGEEGTGSASLQSEIDDKATLTKDPAASIVVDVNNLRDFVGNPIYTSDRLYTGPTLPPGVVTGLAWTSMGGSILYIETILERTLVPSLSSPTSPAFTSSTSVTPRDDSYRPGLIKTGQLGDVMKESSSIAYSFAKSFLAMHFPNNLFFERASLHLHVPEGATPKDGPSAGCTMATSLLSLALGRSVSSDVAMTGELTLTGKVLRIGGVKEKAIAAKRAGVSVIILPRTNEADWTELPDYIREGITVHFVDTYEEIAKIVGLLSP